MRVYFLPGLFGSELSYEALTGRVKFWLSPANIALQGPELLTLAADGILPGDKGVTLIPTGFIEEVYGDAIQTLNRQLEGTGWEVEPYPYDWRLDILLLGKALAKKIAGDVDDGEQCVIIGHSEGGMVARAAWQYLGLSAQQAKVKRIITIGTSHWGSYAAPQIFSQGHDEYAYIDLLNLILAAATTVPTFPPKPIHYRTPDQVTAIAASWPALYQLFPSLHDPHVSADPLRSALFDIGKWSETRGISEFWLVGAQTFHAIMAAPETIPPAGRLTCFAGNTFSTIDRLGSIASLRDNSDWLSTPEGDGVVAMSSAVLPSCVSYFIDARHRYLPANAAASGLLAKEVLADRPDTIPVPEPTGIAALLGFFPTLPELWLGGGNDGLRDFCPKGTRIR